MGQRCIAALLTALLAIAGAIPAFADPFNVLLFASANQFEFPSTGACDLIERTNTLKFMARCDLNESFYVHGFVTSLDDSLGPGGINTFLTWRTIETDTTNPICFEFAGAAVDTAANYDSMTLQTTQEITDFATSNGQFKVNMSAIFSGSDTGQSLYLKRASDGVACTTTSCNGLPLVAKYTRVTAANCCRSSGTPTACCTGRNTGCATELNGPVEVFSVQLNN